MSASVNPEGSNQNTAKQPMILSSELNLTLRPMQYPQFFQLYKNSIKNIWTTDEIDFSIDYQHLRDKLSPQEAHLIKRLVAFFATADNIVAHNLVLNFYKLICSWSITIFPIMKNAKMPSTPIKIFRQ